MQTYFLVHRLISRLAQREGINLASHLEGKKYVSRTFKDLIIIRERAN